MPVGTLRVGGSLAVRWCVVSRLVAVAFVCLHVSRPCHVIVDLIRLL